MREEIKAMLKNKPTSMTEGGLQTRGAIVNMGSIASKVALTNYLSYTTAKHVSLNIVYGAGIKPLL